MGGELTIPAWTEVAKWGPPDDAGEYLCRFDDGAIETFPLDDDERLDVRRTDFVWGVRQHKITHWTELPIGPLI